MKFADIDLRTVGQEVQLVGGIWAGNGQAYLLYLPEFGQEFNKAVPVEMTVDDWRALLRQSDVVETEVLGRSENGEMIKILMRKCERSVDQNATWSVYRRDHYACRYCGNDKVPLTVDHLVLWEDGGPSIEANLVAACRKCNKARGRTQYEQWMQHPFYLRASNKLSEEQRAANWALCDSLKAIPRVHHVKSR